MEHTYYYNNSAPEKCPRCGCKEFEEIDCGADTMEDDLVWTSYVCKNCALALITATLP